MPKPATKPRGSNSSAIDWLSKITSKRSRVYLTHFDFSFRAVSKSLSEEKRLVVLSRISRPFFSWESIFRRASSLVTRRFGRGIVHRHEKLWAPTFNLRRKLY